jgi:cobalt-zinc-cadmium resistance protein CzcA
VRSLSRAGVSVVTVVFEDGSDPYFTRQMVAERLPQLRAAVPSRYGVPELGPMTTGLGEVYQFEVRGDGRSLMELRDILDWQVAPRLRMVPGVVEVNAFGGEARAFEVSVHPDRLRAAGVTLGDVVRAVESNNRAAGGGQIQRGPERLVIRGDALVGTLDDLRAVSVTTREAVPVRLDQVAEVVYAPRLRHGAATRDGRGEAVIGMTMMRLGENSRVVSRAVDRAVREIGRTLPRGVRLEPFYDRTTLVDRTLATVRRNLLEGGVLVVVVLFLMLRNLRAGLVVASVIPLAMLVAVLGMRALGVSGNLMSLGAIDFGLVVDGAIVLIENAVHHLALAREKKGAALTADERERVVRESAREVSRATAFGQIIIALVYVPILALQGVEGKLFHPMAVTVLCALAGAFVLSLTFVPAVASLVLTKVEHDTPSPVVTGARRLYAPVLGAVLAHPVRTFVAAFGALALAALAASSLGSEFVPRLDEGAIVIEAVRLPSASLERSVRDSLLIERTLGRFPEVATVVSKTGRPEVANDPMGVEMSDVLIMLRPTETPREALTERLDRALREGVPGVVCGFTQPIEMRTNELISGVRSDFAVKIYGDDIAALARFGERASRALSRVRGAVDVRVDRLEGSSTLRLDPDRDALALRGMDADTALTGVEAVGGLIVGEAVVGRRRYPIQVRLDAAARQDFDVIARLPLRDEREGAVTLGEVVRPTHQDEPVVLNHEALSRRVIVQANVRGRDLGGFAAEAMPTVERAMRLPAGYRSEYGGQFENLARARARLALVVPVVLVMILFLLRASFDATGPALLIFVNVPFAVVGGVAALWARGMPFSISAAIGFIALSGVAVLNGLVLVTQVRDLLRDGSPAEEAVREGSLRRLRPVLTTALVASLGFVPMAFGHGAGAEVQRPIATVVIGGLVTATLATLLVLPALQVMLGRRQKR